jgi:glycosyltransferase involved in cell wall biosynthesis
MRVGFDTSPLVRPFPLGIVRVVRSLVEALEERGKMEVVRLEPQPKEDLSRWRRRLGLQVERDRLLGIHSFLSAFPRIGHGRRVQTIHELPWRHDCNENAGWKHKAWAAFGPLFADRVVTATAFTARDIKRRVLPGAQKVRVIPWGVDEEFCEEPPAGVVDEVLLGKYRIPEGPFLLAPGAVRAKKRLALVVRGLAQLHASGGPKANLIVTGEHTTDLRSDLGLVQKLGLSRYISTPGTIPEEDWPGMLRLAAGACVLSASEGFALPVLEALGCGTPVVVPQSSAQAEVGGSDAILVDAPDADSVAQGMLRAITEREALRYVLPERARAFPWSRTAEGVEALWKELA